MSVAVLIAAAALAAAQAPDDLARGSALRKAGQAAEAIAPLERATQASPQDADAWLNLGLAYSATGRLEDAERALNRAQSISPDYADVRIAQARVALFRQDYAEARRRLAPVLAATPVRAEATELAGQIEAARAARPSAWRLDASYTHGDVTGSLPDTRIATLFVGHTSPEQRNILFGVENVRQFGRTDTLVEARIGARRGYLGLGVTPGADFRPKWVAKAGILSDPMGEGPWRAQLGVDAAWARYPVGEVKTAAPTLTVTRGDAITLTARWINILDERDAYRSGYALRGDVRVAPRLSVSAGWADAPESDDGRTVDVRNVSVGVAVDVSDLSTLRLSAGRELRSAYDRDEVTFGFTHRF